MTGWQGNEGNQGAWGPQGTQPYGGQPGDSYGQDPYYSQPDPYSGHQAGYQTGGFPAQGYPAGYQPGYQPPPPPPSRSKLPMILGVLAIVIIVGAVVTIVLVNRDSGGSPTAAPSSTSAPPDPSTRSGPRSSSAPSSSAGPDTRDGWQTVDNTADSGLVYEVPPEWKVVPDTRASGLGVDFTGTADFGSYQCEEATYVRSFATSGDVQAKDGEDLDLAKAVTDFANSFAKGSFKETAQVAPAEPAETEIDGRQAMTLIAKVTPQVTVPACEATEGEVAIVGVLLEEDGKPTGVAMLVVVSDVTGGPADPKPLPKSVAQEILASTTVG